MDDNPKAPDKPDKIQSLRHEKIIVPLDSNIHPEENDDTISKPIAVASVPDQGFDSMSSRKSTRETSIFESEEINQKKSTSAKRSIFLSSLFLSLWGLVLIYLFITRNDNNEFAGLELLPVSFALFFIYLANIIVYFGHLLLALSKKIDFSRKATIFVILPVIVFFTSIWILDTIRHFSEERYKDSPGYLVGSVIPKNNEENRAATSRETKARDLVLEYGFYYITDDASHIDQFNLETNMNSGDAEPPNGPTEIVYSYISHQHIGNEYPTLYQAVFKNKSSIIGRECYNVVKLPQTKPCAPTSLVFQGHPVLKYIQPDSYVKTTLGDRYIFTNGSIQFIITARSDTEAQNIITSLKVIDDKAARNLIKKLQGF